MALSASTVWEVRTTGADTNGGGFVTGASGTDFSQQDAAQFVLTTVTTAAANAICLSASAAATMVGNICQIISGTNFTAGFYQILSVVAGVSFTLDRTCTTAAGSNGVINIGGAIASPGQLGAVMLVSGQKAYMKTGTYTLGSSVANVSTGTYLLNTAIFVSIEGYGVTRGDLITPPTIINAAFTSISIISQTSGRFYIFNVIVDGNSKATTTAFNLNTGFGLTYLCTAQNCTGNGFTNGGALNRTLCVSCVATACSTGFSTCVCVGCEAYLNTSSGFVNSVCSQCLSYSNTSNGFSSPSCAVNCIAYSNGGSGFTALGNSYLASCHAENNTGAGLSGDSQTGDTYLLLNCSTYNNTGGSTSLIFRAIPAVLTLSGSAFVSAGTGNFALNNTAGAGAVLRAAGFPALYPRGLTAAYFDIGAAQHQDTPATNLFIVQD